MTPRTAAEDTCLRLAIGLWAADVRAALTPAQRTWLVERLERHVPGTTLAVPLSDDERARIREPLCAFVKEWHPRIADLVAAQFTAREALELPRRLHHD
jgi:hypothetical protein